MARTVRDCFAAGKTTFSFEFFPPKSDADVPQLWQAIRELESLKPFPLSGGVEQALSRNYKIVRADDGRVFLTPR